jgi:putative endonuclease
MMVCLSLLQKAVTQRTPACDHGPPPCPKRYNVWPMSGRFVQLAVRALDAFRLAFPWARVTRAEHLQTGVRGEEEAYFYLRRRGYVMVARNWRSPRRRGEVDLIGWDGAVLCFVEVKTRTTREVKPAEAAVDAAKQRELASVAREYLRRFPLPPSCRGDVLSIYYERNTQTAATGITLFQNSFRIS